MSPDFLGHLVVDAIAVAFLTGMGYQNRRMRRALRRRDAAEAAAAAPRAPDPREWDEPEADGWGEGMLPDLPDTMPLEVPRADAVPRNGYGGDYD